MWQEPFTTAGDRLTEKELKLHQYLIWILNTLCFPELLILFFFFPPQMCTLCLYASSEVLWSEATRFWFFNLHFYYKYTNTHKTCRIRFIGPFGGTQLGQMNSEIMGLEFNLRLDECKRPNQLNWLTQNSLWIPAMFLLSLCLNAITVKQMSFAWFFRQGFHCMPHTFTGCRGE